jgi:hypothetical protein
MLYRDAGGDVVELAVGADTQVLTLAAGLPSWAAPAASTESHYCLLDKQASQAVSGAVSGTAITFGAGSEESDTEGMHDTATNNSRITVQEAGVYFIGANVRWDNNLSGQRQVDLTINGSTTLSRIINTGGGPSPHQYLAGVASLSASDYVEILCYESSTGVPNVVAGTRFFAYRLTA